MGVFDLCFRDSVEAFCEKDLKEEFMSREKICPLCCNGQGGYYVVVKGATGLQRRTCPLPHEPSGKRKESNKAIGGFARAQKLSPEERSAIASTAARKRWGERKVESIPLPEE